MEPRRANLRLDGSPRRAAATPPESAAGAPPGSSARTSLASSVAGSTHRPPGPRGTPLWRLKTVVGIYSLCVTAAATPPESAGRTLAEVHGHSSAPGATPDVAAETPDRGYAVWRARRHTRFSSTRARRRGVIRAARAREWATRRSLARRRYPRLAGRGRGARPGCCPSGMATNTEYTSRSPR